MSWWILQDVLESHRHQVREDSRNGKALSVVGLARGMLCYGFTSLSPKIRQIPFSKFTCHKTEMPCGRRKRPRKEKEADLSLRQGVNNLNLDILYGLTVS